MNIHRWISARDNAGQYAAMRAQADNAELCHALTLASSALCVGWNANAVRAEMDARLTVALAMIDEVDRQNDNGVAQEIISAPMPYLADVELEF